MIGMGLTGVSMPAPGPMLPSTVRLRPVLPSPLCCRIAPHATSSKCFYCSLLPNSQTCRELCRLDGMALRAKHPNLS